jgi:hypothetical protein
MRKRDTATGQPAVTLPGIVTEQDRAIVARREAGETRKAICEALGVTVGLVQRAEFVCRCDATGRKLLAECPDSIEGLENIGELDGNAAHALRYHHYHHEGPALERLSDVAPLGRRYVSRLPGIGPKSLASIDRALGLFGLAWNDVDRTPKPKPREPEQPANSGWSGIVARIARIERVTGHAIFADDPNRDTVDGILGRMSFLVGYLEKRAIDRICGTPDDQEDAAGDLETAGNIVCLPGVKLADVLRDGGAS